MEKPCCKCRETKPASGFGKLTRTKDGLQYRCLTCQRAARKPLEAAAAQRKWHRNHSEAARAQSRAHYHANKDRHRNTALIRQYGLSLAEYRAMLAAQDAGCAICGRAKPTRKDEMFHVDHCHRTMVVRGLLCQPCNTALGLFEDDPDRLQSALNYLTDPPSRRLLPSSQTA